MFGGQNCVGKNIEVNSCWSGFCQDGEIPCVRYFELDTHRVIDVYRI